MARGQRAVGLAERDHVVAAEAEDLDQRGVGDGRRAAGRGDRAAVDQDLGRVADRDRVVGADPRDCEHAVAERRDGRRARRRAGGGGDAHGENGGGEQAMRGGAYCGPCQGLGSFGVLSSEQGSGRGRARRCLLIRFRMCADARPPADKRPGGLPVSGRMSLPPSHMRARRPRQLCPGRRGAPEPALPPACRPDPAIIGEQTNRAKYTTKHEHWLSTHLRARRTRPLGRRRGAAARKSRVDSCGRAPGRRPGSGAACRTRRARPVPPPVAQAPPPVDAHRQHARHRQRPARGGLHAGEVAQRVGDELAAVLRCRGRCAGRSRARGRRPRRSRGGRTRAAIRTRNQ